jgi:UTP--glucose-1-phosphate uridylyltransferase
LETAMGSAISLFNNSKALVVSRERFVPVKKTTDLLALWSDVYELNEQYQIVLKRG